MNSKGVFITFEGIEASGKSTLARKIFDWLKESGVQAVLTRDPGGTAVGEKIREILLSAETVIDEKTEALLYAAARRQLVIEVIKPALESGKVVVCDRFSDSFLAYQGYGRGLDLSFLKYLNKEATGGIEPDITFLIDLPVEHAMKRLKEKDRMELEAIDFHQKIREGFLKIAGENPDRIVVLDGLKTIDELVASIKAIVARFVQFMA